MGLSEKSRLVLALLLLAAVTLLYLVVDESVHGTGATVSIAAIALALTKVRIIMREFMDVRHAPKSLRTATDILVITMAVCLVATYLTGRAIA